MRTALLVAGLILGLVSVSTAMPVARPPSVSQGHQYYDRDLRGWHRHHEACDTLRDLVGSKNRKPANG
jgi:hypothetical protein